MDATVDAAPRSAILYMVHAELGLALYIHDCFTGD